MRRRGRSSGQPRCATPAGAGVALGRLPTVWPSGAGTVAYPGVAMTGAAPAGALGAVVASVAAEPSLRQTGGLAAGPEDGRRRVGRRRVARCRARLLVYEL